MNKAGRLLIAMLSAVAVVSLVLLDLADPSPGPITTVHAQLADLSDGRACDLCHGESPQDMARACTACHQAIASQLQAASGIHGGLTPEKVAACGTCHQEHHGDAVELGAARSFRLAGLEGPIGFDHGHTDFALDGRHDTLECSACHPNADRQPLPAGVSRYLGQVQSCASCHDDPHAGAMQRSCESCHGQEHPFADLANFLHTEEFPLHGSHGGLACAECHESDSDRSVEALSDADAQLPWRSCVACHESPHRSWKDQACSECHSEKHPDFRRPAAQLEASQHAASGFGLDAPHAGLECAQCHADTAGTSFATRYPGRAADQCRVCHADPHLGQFDHPPYQEQGCLSCHQRHQFTPHAFEAGDHALTSFALEGAHRSAECNTCHDQMLAASMGGGQVECRRFNGTPSSCAACHDDAHQGAFDRIADLRVADGSADCARCHSSEAFHPATSAFQHDRWTAYPLTGAHLQAECEACHPRAVVADPSGRRFGRVAQHFPGNPDSCAGCHADLHQGSFDQDGLPLTVEGASGCARCHDTRAFQLAAGAPFDHRLWTGFALAGAHRQAQCHSCHPGGEALQPPRRLGLAADHARGDPALCASCHQDPHGGVFSRPLLPRSVNGANGCARCHQQNTFRVASLGDFDHDRWTRYPLQGAHAEAECVACHAVLPRPDALGRSTARAPGSACADCHADPHVGQFRAAAASPQTDCTRCHSNASDQFEIEDFDHDRLTSFHLDQDHARLDCAACHQAWPLQGGGSAVRYKPLGIKCQDCHSVVPRGTGGGR